MLDHFICMIVATALIGIQPAVLALSVAVLSMLKERYICLPVLTFKNDLAYLKNTQSNLIPTVWVQLSDHKSSLIIFLYWVRRSIIT